MKNFSLEFAFIAAILVSGGAAAETVIPDPPSVSARAYILQDFHSGAVLAEAGADEILEPASITKIMSVYVVFDALEHGRLKLDDKVKISEKAWRNPDVLNWDQGSRMFAEVGSLVRVDDLLHGMIVQSGNDATVALAERIAGSEEKFVELMNEYAERLGLAGTNFLNSTGWPVEGHHSTARDLATLSRALIRDFPNYYSLFSEKHYTYNNISQANRNSLLWKDPTVDGIKTGHTETAGYCVTASAQRGSMRLIVVVMGAEDMQSRTRSSLELLDYGFNFYETHKLFSAGKVLRESRIWKGDDSQVELGPAQDFYVTIPRGEYTNLEPSMTVKKSIFAPVKKDQELGQIRVELNGEMIQEQPLVALHDVGRGNLVRRMLDHVLYLVK
ncbi:MAG TPA: D-alanyl-D-alanine carboxypeptidase family protein [Gammaproteobacteria bacterium]|nr:D-alanyl-D-alanine carboxypeptidase family protein [Gammaproteobacteria bacterium]